MKAVIILAAGHGTRMKSDLPKVLHEVGGKSMLQWVIEAAKGVEPAQIIAVTSAALLNNPIIKNIDSILQENPKGTGEALQIAYKKLQEDISQVFLMCADTPFLNTQELQRLDNSDADLAVMGIKIQDLNSSYGRIILDSQNKPIQIIETKHNQNAKNYPIANAGVYKINKRLLTALLPRLKTNAESGEIYATDLLELAVKNNFSTELVIGAEENFTGINTAIDLQVAENIFQNKMREKFISSGVKFMDANTCYFNHDTEIENGTSVEPFVIFGKNVKIKANCHVLSFCSLSDCTLESNSSVGPFAHLRGKVILGEKAVIGNFVEIKGSKIENSVKIKHLSYIGDTTVGAKTNIGAGTITCNYNGFEKFKTTIGSNVMVGANSTLVAPITLNDNAYIAAGSVITQNVEENSLAITRTEQKEKLNWAINFQQKYKKMFIT